MSRRDEPPEYDTFLVRPKMSDFTGKPVVAKNGSILFIFIKAFVGKTEEHDLSDIEIWVTKHKDVWGGVHDNGDGTYKLRVQKWWVKKQEELS